MSGRQIDALDVALGEVHAEHHGEISRRMREDRRFRTEVEALAPVVARLERLPREAWAPPDPPPLVVGAPLPPRVRRRRLPVLVLRPAGALACALALIAGGVGGGLLLSGGGSSGDTRGLPAGGVVLEPVGSQTGGRALVVTRDDGRIALRASGLRPDGRGHHELWLLPAGGEPVAVGTFRVGRDGRATATYPLPDDPTRYAALDVSREPPDGDPAHSGDSVLRAPVRGS